MTLADFRAIALSIVLPTFGAIATIVVFANLTRWIAQRKRTPGATALTIAFSSLGVIVGVEAGRSREAVLGAVLPALLTIVSALLAYLLTKEGLAAWKPVIPYCITVLVVGSLIGLAIGGTTRKTFDLYEKQYATWLSRYEKVQLESEKARYLAQLSVWQQRELAKGPAATPTTVPEPPK
jgi:hypothetical protein